MVVTLLIAIAVLSYLLGNVNFARIIAWKQNVDITKQGSGNPGATNTLRTLGGKAGIIVFVLDILKGVIPAIIAVFAFGGYTGLSHYIVLMGTNESYFALFLCGFAAVLGHNFPVIYKFKGGKGIATMFGVFLVAQPILTIIVFIICFFCMLALKYMSAISMLFITTLVVLQMIFVPEGNNVGLYIVLALLLVLTFYGHRSNILRLYRGEESKLDLLKYFKKSPKTQEEVTKVILKRLKKIPVDDEITVKDLFDKLRIKDKAMGEKALKEDIQITELVKIVGEGNIEDCTILRVAPIVEGKPTSEEQTHNEEIQTDNTEVEKSDLNIENNSNVDESGENKEEK